MKRTMTTPILSASTLRGDTVRNAQDEELGKIDDFMLDLANGRIRYAVLSFGGFLGLGDKLFAIPPEKLRIDPENEEIVLDVPKERLEEAPGFDKDEWPDTTDESWQREVYAYYEVRPYW